MSIRNGPIELSFAPASNYPVRYGFPNPCELNENYNLFTVFVDVPGATSSQGFGTNAMTGNGSATNILTPVVLTPPATWTNKMWFASTWLGGFVDERSTATYGTDYRLDGMELNFTNSTPVFTNFITLHLRPNPATNSRLIVLHLEGFNTGANIGTTSNFTYAIIPPNADDDGDGLPDGWEWRFSQSLSNLAATADTDGDGANNLDEFSADTDPLNTNSLLSLTSITTQTGTTRLDWKGGTNASQYIELRTDLLDPAAPWTVLLTNRPPTAIASNLITAPTTNPAHFFRIRAHR